MKIKGIIFDINGTLSDIHTNEWHDDVYRVLGNLLSYQGMMLGPNDIKYQYFDIMKKQRSADGERQRDRQAALDRFYPNPAAPEDRAAAETARRGTPGRIALPTASLSRR